MLKEKVINTKTLTKKLILDTCDALFLSTGIYGIYSASVDTTIGQLWSKLAEDVIIFTIGTFHATKRARRRDVLLMNSMQESIGLRWEGLQKRVEKRAKIAGIDEKVKKDKAHIQKVCSMLNLHNK